MIHFVLKHRFNYICNVNFYRGILYNNGSVILNFNASRLSDFSHPIQCVQHHRNIEFNNY